MAIRRPFGFKRPTGGKTRSQKLYPWSRFGGQRTAGAMRGGLLSNGKRRKGMSAEAREGRAKTAKVTWTMNELRRHRSGFSAPVLKRHEAMLRRQSYRDLVDDDFAVVVDRSNGKRRNGKKMKARSKKPTQLRLRLRTSRRLRNPFRAFGPRRLSMESASEVDEFRMRNGRRRNGSSRDRYADVRRRAEKLAKGSREDLRKTYKKIDEEARKTSKLLKRLERKKRNPNKAAHRKSAKRQYARLKHARTAKARMYHKGAFEAHVGRTRANTKRNGSAAKAAKAAAWRRASHARNAAKAAKIRAHKRSARKARNRRGR